MATNATIGALRVNLGIDTAQFRDGLKGASKSLDRLGKRMQRIGQDLSLRVTAPIAGFAALVLRSAGDFEQAMNRVQAVSGATGEQFKALRNQAKQLGATTQFSASQAAEGMAFLAQAGFEANEIVGAMPGTLQLAAAAQMDLGTAADIVSNVLQGYGLEVSELGRANDVLVSTFTKTNTSLEQLGQSMKFAAPVASAAGVQFEEAAAALGLMGNAGIQASMAGTSLRGAISRILNPTAAAKKAMKQAGLSFTDARGRLLPLVEIIRQLEPLAEDTGLFMQLFGQRAGPAMAALVGQGSGALRELTSELENSGGTAERIASVQMEGFNGALRELRSAFEGLQLAIADSGLLEWATDAVKAVTRFMQSLTKTNAEILKWGTIIAGMAAAIGPGLIALGLLTRGFVMGGAAVAAFGRTFAAFGRLFATVVRDILASIALLIGATSGMVGAFIAATAAILTAWVAFGNTIITVAGEIVMGLRNWFVTKFNSLVVVPFTKLLNQQIMGIPRLIREALGLKPIPLPLDATVDTASLSTQVEVLDKALDKVQEKLLVETDPDALAALNAQGEALIAQIQAIESVGVDAGDRINKAFQGDLDRIKAKFDEVVAGIKSTLPDGLVNEVVGDIDNKKVQDQVAALDSLKEELDDLLGEDFSDLSGGGGAGKKGAKAKAEIDRVAESLRSMAVEAAALRGEFGTLGPETVSLLDNLGLLNVSLQDGQVASFKLAEGSEAIVTAMDRLDVAREVAQIQDSVKTATERLNEQLIRLRELYEQGAISAETFQRAQELVKARFGEMDDAIQHTARGALGNLMDTLRSGETGWKQYARIALDALNRIVDKLMNQVLNALFQVNNAAGGGGGGILGGLLGGIFGGGGGAPATSPLPPIKPFADGGIVRRPTIGLIGEAGPEAVIPLREMADRTSGRRGDGNVYNIDARGADMAAVQRLERSLMDLAGPGRVERRAVNAVSTAQHRGQRLGPRG